MAIAIVPDLAYVFALLTVGSSAFAAWKRRDRHRLDILVLVVLLTLKPLYELLGPIGVGLLFGQVYLLLRLVHQFREVPAFLRTSTLAAAVVSSVVFAVWRPLPHLLLALTWLSLVGLQLYAAGAFTREAVRTRGVTARRLTLAAAGTYLFAASFLGGAAGDLLSPEAQRALARLNSILTTIMLASYYLAFATPRWLRMAWQRAEQARYLSLAAELDPQERGERTARDLSRAAASASGNAAAVVLLRVSIVPDQLAVRGTNQTALSGLSVQAGGGLVGQVLRSGEARDGRAQDCEPALAERLRRYGARVLVAPIATANRTWGVVLVVQRRGSLFPEDDLRLLVQLGRYAGTSLDHAQLVTEARERERKAADRRLREAEYRMSLLLDNIRDYAMYVLDHHGRIVTWHTGAEHVFGYRAEEMTDESAAPLYNMADGEFVKLLAEARALGRTEFEGQCRRRDGAKFTGTTILTTLSGDDRDLEGFVGVTRDVTEQRDLEQRLRQSQKMDAIGRLAGGIAHDFNNLLTAILGYADWLSQDFAQDPQHLHQVQEIQKAAERAASLTRQLLAFSRQQMLQPAPINLSRLTADLLPMLRRLIGEHITVVDQAEPELSPVLGDRSQLEQVIVNLAVNARDAMPSGGTLTIATRRVFLDQASAGVDLLPGPYALLEVCDTGIGMDAATQARIFEPFFTTKESGRGTGLGLATVYGIVKQMGGAIRVESTVGEGTTFRLYFPETRGRESAAQAPAAAAEAAPGGAETVLLVEDESAVRSFLTQVLERQGYRVIAAEHQAAAIALAEAHRDAIDLVITDIVMPGGTGPELVRALGQVRPGLPALYISGYADAVLAAQGAFPKASHFLQKPFSARDLLTRIRQILSRP